MAESGLFESRRAGANSREVWVWFRDRAARLSEGKLPYYYYGAWVENYFTVDFRFEELSRLLSTIGDRAFPVTAAHVGNGLPHHVTSTPCLSMFCSRLKTHLSALLSLTEQWLWSFPDTFFKFRKEFVMLNLLGFGHTTWFLYTL